MPARTLVSSGRRHKYTGRVEYCAVSIQAKCASGAGLVDGKCLIANLDRAHTSRRRGIHRYGICDGSRTACKRCTHCQPTRVTHRRRRAPTECRRERKGQVIHRGVSDSGTGCPKTIGAGRRSLRYRISLAAIVKVPICGLALKLGAATNTTLLDLALPEEVLVSHLGLLLTAVQLQTPGGSLPLTPFLRKRGPFHSRTVRCMSMSCRIGPRLLIDRGL
jgi:hypothetical protein